MTNEMDKDRGTSPNPPFLYDPSDELTILLSSRLTYARVDDHAKLDKLLVRVDTLKPSDPEYAKLVIQAVNAFVVHGYEEELALPILTAKLTEEENTVSRLDRLLVIRPQSRD